MLKIGDFSKLSRVSIRMLRHYAHTKKPSEAISFRWLFTFVGGSFIKFDRLRENQIFLGCGM